MDHTLACIILPMLKQLKSTTNSSPFVNNEDVPKELCITDEEFLDYETGGETDNKWFVRWDYVLNEMIFAFEHLVDEDWEEEFSSGEIDINYEKSNVTAFSSIDIGSC